MTQKKMDDERPIRPMTHQQIKEVRKCQTLLKKGKRKGKVCGSKVLVGDFCGRHSKTKQPNKYSIYVKEHWYVAAGDDFGEKTKDLARYWEDGGNEDGLYHYDGNIYDY